MLGRSATVGTRTVRDQSCGENKEVERRRQLWVSDAKLAFLDVDVWTEAYVKHRAMLALGGMHA